MILTDDASSTLLKKMVASNCHCHMAAESLIAHFTAITLQSAGRIALGNATMASQAGPIIEIFGLLSLLAHP